MQTIKVVEGDITQFRTDAIVNAANKSLLGGGGVDGAIHKGAGKELLEECITLNGCKTGQAKITKGYKLPAKHVIHTVGPVYNGRECDAENLKNCYKNSLDLAKQNNLHSIAFPAISTGVYRYPIEEATGIAVDTVKTWLADNANYDMEVIFCTHGDKATKLYEEKCNV